MEGLKYQVILSVEEMEGLSDAEIVQNVMEMMAGSGNMDGKNPPEYQYLFHSLLSPGPDVMAMMMAEIEKPADCHCIPTEQPHGLLNG